MNQLRIEAYPVQTTPDLRALLKPYNPAMDFGHILGMRTTDFTSPVVPFN